MKKQLKYIVRWRKKLIEYFCPWVKLNRIIRELNTQERLAYGEMYVEYWMNWAENQLREARKPLLMKELVSETNASTYRMG